MVGIVDIDVSDDSLPALVPSFYASGLGSWVAVLSYDACVRLCLNSRAKGSREAPIFLENGCALLQNAFSLQHVLLQPEEELLKKKSSRLSSEGVSAKAKKKLGKMKVQVRKVKIGLDPPTTCSFSSLKPSKEKIDSLRSYASSVKSNVASGWGAIQKVHVSPRIPVNAPLSTKFMVYMHAGTSYVKEVAGLLKSGTSTSPDSSTTSNKVIPETHSCLLRLKSTSQSEAVRMQPGSSEAHVFLPDGFTDDLIVEVHDSNGKHCGGAIVQMADIAEETGDKLRWCSIYHEPDHTLIGRVQLYINYSFSPDEKCGSVAETVAYDLLLEVAMKLQHFKQRNLLLHGSWKWLVAEFASCYGVSDTYANLRYLTYVMDVATPTADCLCLVKELLSPVILKPKSSLSHQENRLLAEVSKKIEDIIVLVFENYKSLDESSPSGIIDGFKPSNGLPAPALKPALKLFMLLNDVLLPEMQLKLCRYFQTAVKKRSKKYLAEVEEFVSSNNGNARSDPVFLGTAYLKMKSLCLNMKNEISLDIKIHSKNLLPSFLDLPNLSSAIYSVQLSNSLREALITCPPSGPSIVAELVIATLNFQNALAHWNIRPIKGGVDAKELFNSYIINWIEAKRLALLEFCRPDKVKGSGLKPHNAATCPFVDEMYDRLKETLDEYEFIVTRWPEYTLVLEKAIADVEKASVEALDKQYVDVLSPLKENFAPIKYGLKYVQKITKGTEVTYTLPDELGGLLNSMKIMLDLRLPEIESQMKSWSSCINDETNPAPGECLNEVKVMLRTKFKNYVQALVEKLVENTRVQNTTKLKKLIQDSSKEAVTESDMRIRMQPLKDVLINTINHLHNVFDNQLFVIICRGFWDRMGQDVLKLLEDRKENTSCYKGSRISLSVLDDIFRSEMQRFLGHSLIADNLEPPRTIMAARAMLCKDSVNPSNNSLYY
ncbi:uncharacterized protein LOC124919388 [Impatiens glandulifera]|uniref:uncharacterized protein LOC124919388 n=1 Tax=Impatiens glandulifera TaxID=253017 RepID=UPI001FB11E34|nr:uncharacterized protein LOC124919388 [Impatiens glandulifera]